MEFRFNSDFILESLWGINIYDMCKYFGKTKAFGKQWTNSLFFMFNFIFFSTFELKHFYFSMKWWLFFSLSATDYDLIFTIISIDALLNRNMEWCWFWRKTKFSHWLVLDAYCCCCCWGRRWVFLCLLIIHRIVAFLLWLLKIHTSNDDNEFTMRREKKAHTQHNLN